VCVTKTLPPADLGIAVFIPFDKVTYRQAATRIARHIAKLRNSGRHGPPTLREHDFLNECLEELGRGLAGGVIKSWGIVTVSWADQWNEYPLGEEIELRPIAWRTPDAKRRITEPPEDGWMSGEIAYEGGRVIAVLESTDLDNYIEHMWPNQPAEVPEDLVPPTSDNDTEYLSPALTYEGPARLAWMLGYAHAFKAHGRLVKRDEAISAIVKTIRCTTRQGEAAYEALPHPELRNPPPVAGVRAVLPKTENAAGNGKP
jgi:hypothetical protein